jgi:hypothetical protein
VGSAQGYAGSMGLCASPKLLLLLNISPGYESCHSYYSDHCRFLDPSDILHSFIVGLQSILPKWRIASYYLGVSPPCYQTRHIIAIIVINEPYLNSNPLPRKRPISLELRKGRGQK